MLVTSPPQAASPHTMQPPIKLASLTGTSSARWDRLVVPKNSYSLTHLTRTLGGAINQAGGVRREWPPHWSACGCAGTG
jgi:hypothetical protein